MGSYSTPDGELQYSGWVKINAITAVGTCNNIFVAGSICRQSATFPEVCIFQGNLPLMFIFNKLKLRVKIKLKIKSKLTGPYLRFFPLVKHKWITPKTKLLSSSKLIC